MKSPAIFNTTRFTSQLVDFVKIRQFEQRDMDAVLRLANEHAFFDGPSTAKDFTVTFSEGFIVAEDNDEIIGLAYSYFKDVPEEVLKTWGVSKVATIELLVVDPKHGKQGVGTLLVESLIGILKQFGAELIVLTCPIQAKQAKLLYEKVGFKVSAYHMRMKF